MVGTPGLSGRRAVSLIGITDLALIIDGLAGRGVMWPEQKDRVEAWDALGATRCIQV